MLNSEIRTQDFCKILNIKNHNRWLKSTLKNILGKQNYIKEKSGGRPRIFAVLSLEDVKKFLHHRYRKNENIISNVSKILEAGFKPLEKKVEVISKKVEEKKKEIPSNKKVKEVYGLGGRLSRMMRLDNQRFHDLLVEKKLVHFVDSKNVIYLDRSNVVFMPGDVMVNSHSYIREGDQEMRYMVIPDDYWVHSDEEEIKEISLEIGENFCYWLMSYCVRYGIECADITEQTKERYL